MHVTHRRIHQQRRVDLEHTARGEELPLRASSAARAASRAWEALGRQSSPPPVM